MKKTPPCGKSETRQKFARTSEYASLPHGGVFLLIFAYAE